MPAGLPMAGQDGSRRPSRCPRTEGTSFLVLCLAQLRARELSDAIDHFVCSAISDIGLYPNLFHLENVRLKHVGLKRARRFDQLIRPTDEPRPRMFQFAVLQRVRSVSQQSVIVV